MSTLAAPVSHPARRAVARCAHHPDRSFRLQRRGIRLTRRGRMTVVAVLTLLMMLFVLAGAFRATAAPAQPPAGWSTVTVEPGDTLWGLAALRTGGDDPRALIAQIKSVNGLAGSELRSGQRLLLPG